MKSFELILDEKVEVWRRTRCIVETNTLEEAIELVKNGEYDCLDSEILYETEYVMAPKDNENEPTVEIFDETVTTCLYHN